MNIVMDASHDQMDRVDRARLVESCGAHDDSPSWNLGRAKSVLKRSVEWRRRVLRMTLPRCTR